MADLSWFQRLKSSRGARLLVWLVAVLTLAVVALLAWVYGTRRRLAVLVAAERWAAEALARYASAEATAEAKRAELAATQGQANAARRRADQARRDRERLERDIEARDAELDAMEGDDDAGRAAAFNRRHGLELARAAR